MEKEKATKKQIPLLPLQLELIDRLRWFIRLRWVAAAGVMATVLAARYVFDFDKLAMSSLLILVGVIAALNLIYVGVLTKVFPAGEQMGEKDLRRAYIFAQIQILLDLVLLTLLLHYSGGLENPFSFFYIFHVIISSILLPRGVAYAYALITVVLYSGLILFEQMGWIPLYPIIEPVQAGNKYLLGVIFAFGATVFIAAYVTTSIRLQLKQKEEEAERAREELSRLEEKKSAFMRMVSHELRSPIAAIQSSLGVLVNLEDGCMDESTRRSVQRAADRAHGLYRLTRDLLEFSRLTTLSPGERSFAETDLNKVVKNIEALYNSQAQDKNLEFRVELPEGAVVTFSDPQSMEQLVDNLVSNAIRYTPEGGKVDLKLGTNGRSASITVSDTGIGIPARDVEKIGEEFYRSENAKKFAPAGTGIGVRIIKEIVKQHGGRLEIKSEEGKGSTFKVELPLKHNRT